jgi:hypothetical protein
MGQLYLYRGNYPAAIAIYRKVLCPLTAYDQSIVARADVRTVWRAITRHIDRTIAVGHLVALHCHRDAFTALGAMPLSLFSGHAALSVSSLARTGLRSLMVAGAR